MIIRSQGNPVDKLEAAIRELPAINYKDLYMKLENIKYKLKDDPTDEGLGPINTQVANLQELKSDVCRMLLQAIKNKDRWQRAYRAASKEYDKKIRYLYATREDIKGLRSLDEKRAKAEQELEKEKELLTITEKHYFKEGNSEGGQSVNLLTAIYAVQSMLESANSNLRMQIGVVDDMLNIRELTEDVLKARREAAQRLKGGRNGS